MNRADAWLVALLATITAAVLVATVMWLARQPEPASYPTPAVSPQPSPTPVKEA